MPAVGHSAHASANYCLLYMQDPNSAVSKACQWRAATLGALCADSLGVVAEALKQRGSGSCWQFRQLARNLTGRWTEAPKLP